MKQEIGDLLKKTKQGQNLKDEFNNEMFNKTFHYQQKYNFE